MIRMPTKAIVRIGAVCAVLIVLLLFITAYNDVLDATPTPSPSPSPPPYEDYITGYISLEDYVSDALVMLDIYEGKKDITALAEQRLAHFDDKRVAVVTIPENVPYAEKIIIISICEHNTEYYYSLNDEVRNSATALIQVLWRRVTKPEALEKTGSDVQKYVEDGVTYFVSELSHTDRTKPLVVVDWVDDGNVYTAILPHFATHDDIVSLFKMKNIVTLEDGLVAPEILDMEKFKWKGRIDDAK